MTKLWQHLHGANQIFGRSNIWLLRHTVHTGPANRPQIRSLRRANIRPLRKATFFGTRPVKLERAHVNGVGRSNICTVPQRGCKYNNQEVFSKREIVFTEFSKRFLQNLLRSNQSFSSIKSLYLVLNLTILSVTLGVIMTFKCLINCIKQNYPTWLHQQ